MLKKLSLCLLLFAVGFTALIAQQPNKPSASELYHDLQKVNFIGTALYIAAHPDDENTRLISYLANDVKARTAYLSLTRGDGGQNLVGPEIRELLGVIRTQELLAARRTDGGEQLFTRANDFGYSKHPDETLEIWNEEEVLGDVVRAIRKFKPDVIINRFDHRSPGSTHGHHTSSAMLSVAAFDVLNDPSKYPASANMYGTWQPKRLFFNTSWWFYGSREKFEAADKTNLVEVETGNYYASLGLSNGEIASLSRSMHKSQGFGSTGSRGAQTEYLEFLKGEMPKNKANVFDGIDTSWNRLDGGAAIGAILKPLEENFDFKNPSAMLPQLTKAYTLVKNLKDTHWRDIKLKQLETLLLNCGGIFLEAVANTNAINPNENYELTLEAINRSNSSVIINGIKSVKGDVLVAINETLLPNQKKEFTLTITSSSTKVSAPYWLNQKGTLGMYKAPEEMIGLPETPAPEQVIFDMQLKETQISVKRDVVYKFNDPVKGEVYQPLEVVPAVTSTIPEKVLIFSSSESRIVPVTVLAGRDASTGTVTLQHPKGWQVTPAQGIFNIETKGQAQTLQFTVTPPKDQSEGYLRSLVQIGDQYFDKELVTIDYDHIPFQRVLLPSEAKIVRIDIEKKGQNIGYIDGAGDAIPQSLREIGYDVTTIVPSDIIATSLKQYDAIVIGIRAYNTVPELEYTQTELNTYVENGGTLLLQYNTAHRMVTKDIGPYPISLSRDRVTDEFSNIRILAPKHTVLNNPNEITKADFDNWVQERGLYFPNEWDEKFTPILGMNDKGYDESQGSLLVAPYGNGYYIYTGLSFFRELPAGVPGAYRLFANLLSIGK